jgi:hypothetical protein
LIAAATTLLLPDEEPPPPAALDAAGAALVGAVVDAAVDAAVDAVEDAALPMLLRLSCCLRLESQEWPVSPMMQGLMQPVEFAFDGVADEREKVAIPVVSAYGIIFLAFPVI